jgi:hypothetical protein
MVGVDSFAVAQLRQVDIQIHPALESLQAQKPLLAHKILQGGRNLSSAIRPTFT